MQCRLLLLTIGFASSVVLAASEFKNADFEIKLGSDWRRTVLIGAEHVYFASKQANVSIKIDSLRHHAKPENLVKAGNAIVESALKAEQAKRPHDTVTMIDHHVSRSAESVRVTYSGRDSTQRSFKFVGFITDTKFVYLYFETPTRYDNQLEAVVDEVLAGFKY